MKVVLINPPRENEILANNPAIIDEERGFNPPLGLLYLAGTLEQQGRHQVSIIDSQVEKLSYPGLEARLRALQPEVVGLTAMTMTLLDVVKTVELIKGFDRNIRVVLGGPHVHLFPDETLGLGNIDYLVLGEGEEPFSQLLDRMDDLNARKEIPGLVFSQEGQIIHTGIRPLMEDLDRIPFPARHLVPYLDYTSLLSKGQVVSTIFTSRGCPFQCTFCDRPHLGKRFRARSAENVVDELEACARLGIRDFLFYDDTFTVDKERVLKICREIEKRKLSIAFDIRTRIDTVNEEIIQALKRAGCLGIHYGVEAGTEKILKVLNKGITIPQVKKIFDLTRKHGIQVLAYFMIGNPGETREEVEETFRVMKRLNPDYVHLTIFTPFPGTQLYFQGLKSGIIHRDYWREFSRNPQPSFTAPHWEEHFTREELLALVIEGYKGFYSRPTYILKELLKVRSLGEFRKKAAAGLKVLRLK